MPSSTQVSLLSLLSPLTSGESPNFAGRIVGYVCGEGTEMLTVTSFGGASGEVSKLSSDEKISSTSRFLGVRVLNGVGVYVFGESFANCVYPGNFCKSNESGLKESWRFFLW